jgi:spore coat protein U domain-containing protein, fimbrial subunit CupE1/2/3/6
VTRIENSSASGNEPGGKAAGRCVSVTHVIREDSMSTIFRIQGAIGALVLAAGFTLSTPLGADAITTTGSMTVTAGVVDSCMTSASAAAFGNLSFSVATTTTSTITVTCTNGAAVSSVGLDSGLNVVATQRFMKFGTQTIAYNLYQDPVFATAWTNAAWPAIATFTAGADPSTFTVYAKAPAGVNLTIGTYTDTVGVTVTYS